MKNTLLKLMAFAFATIAISSCYKTSAGLGGAGITVVDIPNYSNVYGYDLVAGTQSFKILQVNRDVPNAAALNTAQTVTVKLDNSVITAYNSANGTSYIPLATSVYTFDAASPISGGNITLSYAPGEFSKAIIIKLDLTQLPAGSNALGFTITQTSYGIISGNLFQGFVAIGAKNRFDGHYVVSGTMVDAANGTLTGNYPNDVNLISNGALQVNMFDLAVPGIYHSILSGGSLSYYGSMGVVFNFDADNNVTSVINYYGQPASNTRSLVLDPSGVNKWDATTKTLKVKYFMDQPSVMAGHRTSFDETYKYVGPR